MSGEKVLLHEIGQIGIVVKDIQKSMAQYWNLLGIGPWRVYTLAPPDLTDTTVHGKPTPYAMRIAIAMIGSLMVELIQPLWGESTYQEFLEERGEGLHHIASYRVEDVEGAIEVLERKGIGVLQSGRWHGAYFAYMDTEEALGVIVELVRRTGERPPPEATYP
ncbi:MAG: VOC family protein [Candidatus Bathyarchaeia archaeon]